MPTARCDQKKDEAIGIRRQNEIFQGRVIGMDQTPGGEISTDEYRAKASMCGIGLIFYIKRAWLKGWSKSEQEWRKSGQREQALIRRHQWCFLGIARNRNREVAPTDRFTDFFLRHEGRLKFPFYQRGNRVLPFILKDAMRSSYMSLHSFLTGQLSRIS